MNTDLPGPSTWSRTAARNARAIPVRRSRGATAPGREPRSSQGSPGQGGRVLDRTMCTSGGSAVAGTEPITGASHSAIDYIDIDVVGPSIVDAYLETAPARLSKHLSHPSSVRWCPPLW